MKRKPKTTTTPFSPALNIAINAAAARMTQELTDLFRAEAAALKLPDGWSADPSKREWTVPA